MITTLIAASMLLAPADWKVVEVREHEVFAGKLGTLVREEIIAERSGVKVEIHVAERHHTRFGARHIYFAGMTLELPERVQGGTVTLSRDSIRVR